jgi:hypothetical protein
MADTPEAKVKKKVKVILESLGAYYTMPVAGVFGRSGVPDILCCLNGRFVAIECKANGGKTTRLQDSNLTAIAKAGGIALVVDETNLSSLGADLLKLVSGGSHA